MMDLLTEWHNMFKIKRSIDEFYCKKDVIQCWKIGKWS